MLKVVQEKRFSSIKEAYAPENFELFAEICTQKISQYLRDTIRDSENTPVFALGLTPEKAEENFHKWLSFAEHLPQGEQFSSFLDLILKNSMHLHHPHYVGHQVAPALPLASVVDMLAAVLNNSSVVFEMGPMEAVLEKHMIEFFASHIGWASEMSYIGGFFTSGGSLGNLSALVAARNKALSETGAASLDKFGVIVSAEAHYSIIRSLRIMGISDAHIFRVSSQVLTYDSLQDTLNSARKSGIHIFATVLNACSTATGTFDDIEEAAKFCQRQKIWLHVDAAHGGAAILSQRLKPILQGLDKADSVIIDAHKMLLMPALLTAVLFRNSRDPQRNCPENSDFLFDDAHENDWYTLGRQTLECTKKMMVLKLFISIHLYGEQFFIKYVEQCYDLTQYFYERIQASENLEALKRPEFNIICFRIKHGNTALQINIRDALLREGEYYLVSATIAGETYLRCTIINPNTTEDVLSALVERIEDLARSYRKSLIPSFTLATC